MIDLIALRLLAGDGGHGRVSFRREKYIPKGGPDGGQGGDGGSIIIRVNPRLTTLQHLSGISEIHAKSGQMGGKRRKSGAKGQDEIIEVPPGTSIWLVAENQISYRRRVRYGLTWKLNRSEVDSAKYFVEKEGQLVPPRLEDEDLLPEGSSVNLTKDVGSLKKIAKENLIELTQDNPEVVIVQGGFGGRGSESFKSSSNTTPLEAEYGTVGEQKSVVLELKLLANVGLVGFPNAGKSTLLSTLTKARPKIANYPFTTLEPQLGVLAVGSGVDAKEVIVADIPGLIEGAHAGKGLGFAFLRHLEHCQTLVYVLFLEDEIVMSETLNSDQKAQALWSQYQALQNELKSYDEQLVAKKSILSINKIDIYNKEDLEAIKSFFQIQGVKPLFISGYTGEGLPELRQEILTTVNA